MIPQAKLDDLEKLAREATPGEWTANEWCNAEGYPGWCAVGPVHCGDEADQEDCCPPDGAAHADAKADSAFIAAANPQTILALVAEVRAAMGLVTALEFYAHQEHMMCFENWDTVSGEDENWLFPQYDKDNLPPKLDFAEGLENGGIARQALSAWKAAQGEVNKS